MAYIARLRTAGAASGTLTAAPFVPARGDKWYMDPEEMRQYDTPFQVKWGGGFPTSWGPNWRHDVFMNKNNMYPRMPYYQRQLKNPHLKYDYGIGIRKNYGETFHILEEWMTPQGQDWARQNGTENNFSGFLDVIFFFSFLYLLVRTLNYMDKEWALSMFAPKCYPYDNLWVEQGGNPNVPSGKRPYTSKYIPNVAPDFAMQK